MNMRCNRSVCVSLGAYGRVPHEVAIAEAVSHPPMDPLLGKLSAQRLQLCPQNRGCLTAELAQQLRGDYPQVEWRLHANVRLADNQPFIDLCDWPTQKTYFEQVKMLSWQLGAAVYSAHAGRRENASVKDVIRYSHDMTNAFGIPVAIEGHYPTARGVWLFDCWEEYQQLLESGAYFALDLSHLNILAMQSGRKETRLVTDLLASERCVEIHVSGNDGSRDQHLPLTDAPWWFDLLKRAHPAATLFYEGRISLHESRVTP